MRQGAPRPKKIQKRETHRSLNYKAMWMLLFNLLTAGGTLGALEAANHLNKMGGVPAIGSTVSTDDFDKTLVPGLTTEEKAFDLSEAERVFHEYVATAPAPDPAKAAAWEHFSANFFKAIMSEPGLKDYFEGVQPPVRGMIARCFGAVLLSEGIDIEDFKNIKEAVIDPKIISKVVDELAISEGVGNTSTLKNALHTAIARHNI